MNAVVQISNVYVPKTEETRSGGGTQGKTEPAQITLHPVSGDIVEDFQIKVDPAVAGNYTPGQQLTISG